MTAGRREFAVFAALSIVLHLTVLAALRPPAKNVPPSFENTVLFRFDRLADRATAPARTAAAPRPRAAAPPLAEPAVSAPESESVARDKIEAPRPQEAVTESRPAPQNSHVDGVERRPTEDRRREPGIVENRDSARMASIPNAASSPASTADAAAPAADSSSKSVTATYEQVLAAWLDHHKYYPAPLRRRGLEGSGEIRIRIDRSGTVLYAAMDRRLPNALLDEVALDWARRSDPFPAMPESIRGETYEFIAPVQFTIR